MTDIAERPFVAALRKRIAECPDCRECAAHANSDATTPGFFFRHCEKHRELAVLLKELSRAEQENAALRQERDGLREALRLYRNWHESEDLLPNGLTLPEIMAKVDAALISEARAALGAGEPPADSENRKGQ